MKQFNPAIQEQDLLISRQVIEGVFTLQEQKQLQISNCLIIGLKGLGFEVVKNLYFLGVQNIFICDDSNVEPQDSSFNMFYHRFKDSNEFQTRSSVCKVSMEQFQKTCQLKICNLDEAKDPDFLSKNKINYVIMTEFIYPSLQDLFKLNIDCQVLGIGFVFTFCSITFSFQYTCFSKDQRSLPEMFLHEFNEKPNVYSIYNQTPRNFKLQKKRTFALFKFLEHYSHLPRYKNEDDIITFQQLLNNLQTDFEYNQIELEQNKKLSYCFSLSFIVAQSFWAPFSLGSIIEHIKFKQTEYENTNKQMIGWSDFNLIRQDFNQFENISLLDPYLNEKRIFGEALYSKIQQSNYLVAGCGAIGCEQAKSLLLLGAQNITLVDNDTIEISNFNRQIFYGREDNKQSKAETLKKKLESLNPLIKCKSVIGYLCQENESSLFGFDDFLKQNLILCCFDNPLGRYYLSQTAKQTFTCLIDSATHGFISQSQIQIPQHISTIQIAKEAKTLLQEIPKCTLSENHKTSLEAIAWCKYFFSNEFSSERMQENDLDLFIKNEELNSLLENDKSFSDVIDLSQKILIRLSFKYNQNTQLKEIIEFKEKFQFIYYASQIILQMLGIETNMLKFEHVFFEQNELQRFKLKTKDNLTKVEFDKSDLIHLNFLYYLTNLRCQLFDLETPEPLYIIQKGNDINGAIITSTSQSAASALLEYFKYMIYKDHLKDISNQPDEIQNALKQIQFRLYDSFLTQNIMYSVLQIKEFYCYQIKNNKLLLADIVEQVNQNLKQEIVEQITFKQNDETITIYEKNLEQEIYDENDKQILENLKKENIQETCLNLNIPLRKNKYFELMLWSSKDQQVPKLNGIIKIYK